MDDRRILGILGAVDRFAAGEAAPNLAQLGLRHGFYGRQTPPPAAHYVKQVHGITVVDLPAGTPGLRGEGDAVTTKATSTPVAVRTADCLPILMADCHRRGVFAVHAGWRGLTAGIIPAAVAHAVRSGIPADTLVAAVGPAISRASFEVGPEVVDALLSGKSGVPPGAAGWCISKGKGDRWHVDLASAALLALAGQGIPPAQLAAMDSCTMLDATRWYSYRREGQGVGSNWAWISL